MEYAKKLGYWDTPLRKLVRGNARAFLKFVLPRARFIRQLPEKIGTIQLEVDVLILAEYEGHEVLVNIELQTYYDAKIAERLLKYNVWLRTEYSIPVYSFVLHLLDDTALPASPLDWTIVPGGPTVIQFNYGVIELSQLKPEDILRLKLRGLYPLLPLTRGGASRTVVERMFGMLGETGKTDLELVGFTLASYVFMKLQDDEQDWLARRFHKMHDILHETPIYQLILQEGRDEGIQQGQRQALQEAIFAVVLERFPRLIKLAEKRVVSIEHPAVLQRLLVKLSTVETVEEAKRYLNEIED